MKIVPALLLGVGLLAGFLPAAAQGAAAPPHHPVSLQILHPLATSSDPETSTNLRLGLIYARSGSILGADFTGVFSQVSGDFSGLALTGGVSNLQADGTGFQYSGLANYVDGMFTGCQFAGFLNYTHQGMFGAQFSGLMNINDGYGGYLQLSGVANVNVKGFSGLQAAFFINHANAEIAGAQLGMLNFAEEMLGAQIGVINLSRQFNGLQVGIVNFNRHYEGTPVGLFNFATGSRREWVFAGGSSTTAQAGFRTVVNHWSSVVSVGWGDLQGDVSENFLLGWHFGRQIPFGRAWSLTVDIGYQHIMRTTSDHDQDNVAPHFNLQARLLGEYRVTSSIGIFAAGGLSAAFTEYSSHAKSTTDPLLMGGLSIGLDP